MTPNPYAIERPETYVKRPPPKPRPLPEPAEATAAKPAEPSKTRARYPSDLSDSQWRRVQPLVERPENRRGRRPNVSMREIVDAMHYRWTTNCAWRMLPHDFPPWNTVYFYYRAWRSKGILPRLQAMLIERPVIAETLADQRERQSA